jgi:CubicO group peptidase (beta-lactamase class C family)
MHTPDPAAAGFDPDRLDRLAAAIESDIQSERYDGCELVVARGGQVGFHRQFGFAERATGRRVAAAQPFVTMSLGKQFLVALVLQRIERGDFALTTRVADLIPAFGQRGKGRVTIAHVLTHTGGLPPLLPAVPIEQLGNLQAVVEATCATAPEARPGTRVFYSAVVAHALLAECVRRADGKRRPIRQILADDLFTPLGMRDTALGCPARLRERRAPVVARDRRPGAHDPDALEALGMLLDEETEIPAAGYLSTAPDVHRFAEMLRRGGELDGVRILAPATVAALSVNHTGDEVNSFWAYTEDMRGWEPFPANLGLGFYLRGEGVFPTPFGQLASPATFGGIGAGSTVFWIDPVRALTYAFLSSGLMEDSYSLERHQRLADLAHGACLDEAPACGHEGH